MHALIWTGINKGVVQYKPHVVDGSLKNGDDDRSEITN